MGAIDVDVAQPASQAAFLESWFKIQDSEVHPRKGPSQACQQLRQGYFQIGPTLCGPDSGCRTGPPSLHLFHPHLLKLLSAVIQSVGSPTFPFLLSLF